MNTAKSKYVVNPTDVDAIFSLQNIEDYFTRVTVYLRTMSGTTYEITLLPGPIQRGVHRGKEVNFRHVNYIRTELHQRPVKTNDQFVYFTGALMPRIHFYNAVPRDDGGGKETAIVPEFLDPDVMALVIDWK
ncbi:MAG: hypothetical protein JWN12_502 [Candidatus Saccharibacteria bacterium]|nr:hypothetical protein [Candidatus Saccharibacteria bacterium]